jgi:IclR family transcriptional regulator, acetate operon repressor
MTTGPILPVPATARPTYASGTLAKGLQLLEALLFDAGRSGLAAVARALDIPLATAHRLALTLEADGYLERAAKGIYMPGPRLLGLVDAVGGCHRLAAELRQPLSRLASQFGAYGHAGILEENMVTYVVKERGGATDLFTAEQMQLEAYCSAIGKILLAALPDAELGAYLDQGPFIALTANTITDPAALKDELLGVRESWVAFDRHEISGDLYCLAVPVRSHGGEIRGAMSLSFVGRAPDAATERLALRKLKALAARTRHRDAMRAEEIRCAAD